jgi:hypothetical protein
MADGNPKYEKVPRPESILFFEKGIRAHKVVSSSDKLQELFYNIKRTGGKSELKIFLTNLYIVGIADVHEILGGYPKVNGIVTMSAWNSYSNEAKAFCKSSSIGLFRYNEFYGALYYDEDKFYNYETPKKED